MKIKLVVNGLKVHTPFKVDSFDKTTLNSLLQLNKFSEHQIIANTLNFEGRITGFLKKQNFPLEKYLNGAVFEIMPESFATAIIESWPFMPNEKLSKSYSGDELIIKTMRNIDYANNLRLAVQLYLDNGGYPPTSEKINLFSDSFMALIQKELQKTPKRQISKGRIVFVRDVYYTMKQYVEDKPSLYVTNLTIFLYPFFLEDNKGLLSEEALKFTTDEGLIPGKWLIFKED